jgi:hypothetical protein
LLQLNYYHHCGWFLRIAAMLLFAARTGSGPPCGLRDALLRELLGSPRDPARQQDREGRGGGEAPCGKLQVGGAAREHCSVYLRGQGEM